MTNRKAARRARRIRRTVLTVCLMALVAVVSIGATVAYLTASTGTITNTFTTSEIEITLTETKNSDGTTTTNANNIATWSAQLVPGETYAKNPVVSVVDNETDVDVYLFVKFEEVGNPATYLTYTSNLNNNNGWYQVSSESNVWYRVVGNNDATQTWNLLAGNTDYTDGCVTVKSDLTETQTQTTGIELKYTAYAIQKDGFASAEAAWVEVPKN